GMIPLTSAIATIGRNRKKRRNNEKKSPKLPAKVSASTQVGVYEFQLDGRKSRESDVTMMTKRSNHIPTLTQAATPKMTQGLLRARRDQNTWGAATLQDTIVQYAQAYGPNARLMKTNPSAGFPLYHEMKNSIAYA